MFGGANANLKVTDEIKSAVTEAVEKHLRAVKVVVDATKEQLTCAWQLPVGTSFAEDFAKVAASFEDGIPCLMLLRMVGANDADASEDTAPSEDWALLAWSPDDAPVKQKMLCASSRKTLQSEFEGIKFKEYQIHDRDDASVDKFLESTRKLTNEQRRSCMTLDEVKVEDAKKQMLQEQKAAPKRLAGLVALQVKPQESCGETMSAVFAAAGKVAILRLAGTSSEELSGEVIDGISKPSELRGKLPEDVPCYFVFPIGTERGLLATWLPDNSPAKLRMKCSTFKASVLDLVKEAAGEREVTTAEVSDEDDLSDGLLEPKATPAGAEESRARPQAMPLPGMAGGYRPPGAVAMPGMGGGAGYRPPAGAVAMPGMGGPRPPGGVALPGMRPAA